MEVVSTDKSIELRIANMRLRDDGIIQLDIKDDVTLEVEDIESINTEINKLAKGRKHLILVVTGERNSSTRAARKASIEQLRDEDYALAEALVINSLPTRIAANFFFKLYQPKFPYKNFKSKKKAENWLREFL